MGKNLIQQRRGKGNPKYRSPSHKYIGKLSYDDIPSDAKEGVVVDIVHSAGKYTPVAIVKFGDKNSLLIAGEGVYTGQKIIVGSEEKGSISTLGTVSEGAEIFNIELRPGDGGKLCRAPGTYGKVISRTASTAVVELPSRKKIELPLNCRVTVGMPAGYGRGEKPMVKAGKMFHIMKAQNTVWPRTKAVAKNAVDHPLGGKTKPGKPLTTSRHASAGAKYGSLSPKRTGKRNK